MKTRRIAPALLLALTLSPGAVAADPIRVTSGFLSVTGLSNNAFFEFEGPGLRAAGTLEPGVVGPDLTCTPCEAGSVISLDTSFLGSSGGGTATVDGTDFPQIGFGATGFLFDSSDIVAPDTAGSFTVTRPFTFSGTLTGFAVFDPDQVPIFTRQLTGQGTVTASLLENPNPGGPPLFFFRSVRYDFADAAPVPEPATLLLAATGLGTLLRMRKRSRRTAP